MVGSGLRPRLAYCLQWHADWQGSARRRGARWAVLGVARWRAAWGSPVFGAKLDFGAGDLHAEGPWRRWGAITRPFGFRCQQGLMVLAERLLGGGRGGAGNLVSN